jgi:hypothetical protein
VKCLRSCRYAVSHLSTSFKKINFANPRLAVAVACIAASVACLAQDQSQRAKTDSQPDQTQAEIKPSTVTIPAGTQLPLVLTHPIQSRVLHRGNDIYAQVTAPVNSGNEVVIPPGTFVQGTIDKLEHKGGRGELHLQSMSITFPDGYVAPISGPVTLETNEGYAIKDPGQRRMTSAFIFPAAGAGLGALIGHSAGTASSTVTSNFPPGCVGGPPFCTPTSTPVFGTKARDAIIGAGIGGVAGGFASMALLFGSHHFFIDVGAPVEITLQHPVTLQQDEVIRAVKQSEEHPIAEQPTAPRPLPPVPPNPPANNGTCWTPGTPGTPPQTVPGPPNPDGTPGPPTIIPGTPGTPPTPYPCP